jgi:2-polyprenyl-6-methoxyphenol hydroxylase-like FAD-dependent oxidoreductase
MGGLVAARALADAFEEVLVLERDELPACPSARLGTPQGHHAHALLAGGQQALEQLFPGFVDDLGRQGAVPYRVGLDTLYDRPGFDPFPRRDLGWVGYAMSRALIEHVVRTRLAALGNVRVRGGVEVTQLVAGTDGARVTGVRCEHLDGPAETLVAELVVDASGRGTLTQELLATLGRPPPEETSIGIDFGYASAVFDVRPDDDTDWKVALTFPQLPATSKGAVALPLEGGRRIVSLGGRHGERPPGDWEGFQAYARQLRTQTIYQVIQRGRRLTQVVRHGLAASLWRHYERIADPPRGLLAFADAFCRFNPIYGQGMSVAAQEACLLRALLDDPRGPDPLAGVEAAFYGGAAALLEAPWAMAALPDFVHPETRGERPADFEASLRFAQALTRLAALDPAVHRLTMRVQHLLEPRTVYRDPALQARVRELMAANA